MTAVDEPVTQPSSLPAPPPPEDGEADTDLLWRHLLDASGTVVLAVDRRGRIVEATGDALAFGLRIDQSLQEWWTGQVAESWGPGTLGDLLVPRQETTVRLRLTGGEMLQLTARPVPPSAGPDPSGPDPSGPDPSGPDSSDPGAGVASVLGVVPLGDSPASYRELAEARARLNDAEHLAHLGSFTWDPTGGTAHWSDEMLRIFGYDPLDAPWAGGASAATAFSERVHPDDRSSVVADWRAAATGQSGVTSYRIIRPDGEVRWLVGRTRPVLDEQGQLVRVVGTVQDVTEEHMAAEVLQHLALHDALTGLPNRVLFMDRLSHALDRRGGARNRVAVLFCDVDHFKWVNDSLGHDAGDRLLVELGRRLSAVVRPGDTIGRLGGDEFAVLCEDLTSDVVAGSLAERVRAALAAPFDVGGAVLVPTVSIGIALARAEGGDNPDGVLRQADAAMYRAKERGRDRVEAFDEGMRTRALLRVRTEAELRPAIEREEVVPWYQPHIDLATGAIAGAEALARWLHPQRGTVLPADFVAVAEETGLILNLGVAILRRALLEAVTWPAGESGPISVAVNLSGRQLLSPELPSVVQGALTESGIDPGLLCLEITESVLLSDADQSALAVGALRDLGVRIAVDDFGTGYSSLTYLRRFPLDVLKIDRSFVAGIARDRADRSIVAATIALARDLGLITIAEGVETGDQAADLGAMGCQFGQGFLWSEAVGAVAFHRLLDRPATSSG